MIPLTVRIGIPPAPLSHHTPPLKTTAQEYSTPPQPPGAPTRSTRGGVPGLLTWSGSNQSLLHRIVLQHVMFTGVALLTHTYPSDGAWRVGHADHHTAYPLSASSGNISKPEFPRRSAAGLTTPGDISRPMCFRVCRTVPPCRDKQDTTRGSRCEKQQMAKTKRARHRVDKIEYGSSANLGMYPGT